MQNKLKFVCATREKRDQFFAKTALGRSLATYNHPASELRLFPGNTRGLPSLYNDAIAESEKDPGVLIFIHDDVYLCDFYWRTQVLSALNYFDVVGLAGNRRRVPRQPSWACVDEKFTLDALENLSGVVGHGKGFPPDDLSVFGPPGQEVKLLDGLMLVVRSETLLANDILFDEQFEFHFYDLDFCRQCEEQKLAMGTWPISIVHESGGNFGSPAWRAAYTKYLSKWGS